MSDEPYSEYGQVVFESGIPMRIDDSGGQGNWARVPAPTGGQVGDVLTVESDLSVGWEAPASAGQNLYVADDSEVLTSDTYNGAAVYRRNVTGTINPAGAIATATVLASASIGHIVRIEWAGVNRSGTVWAQPGGTTTSACFAVGCDGGIRTGNLFITVVTGNTQSWSVTFLYTKP